MSLSQRPSLTASGEGVTLLHELLGFLRRSLSQQAAVRRAVYQVGLPSALLRLTALQVLSAERKHGQSPRLTSMQCFLFNVATVATCAVFVPCFCFAAGQVRRHMSTGLGLQFRAWPAGPAGAAGGGPGGAVLEMLLLPHFRQLLEPDPALHPPIKLERCAAIAPVQAMSVLLTCLIGHSPAGSASDEADIAACTCNTSA